MKLFCRLLGHTWVPIADNPKTSWNVDKDGVTLLARQASEIRFWNECARCKEREEVVPARKR